MDNWQESGVRLFIRWEGWFCTVTLRYCWLAGWMKTVISTLINCGNCLMLAALYKNNQATSRIVPGYPRTTMKGGGGEGTGQFSRGEKRVAALLCIGSTCFTYMIMLYYFLRNSLPTNKPMACIGMGMMICISILQLVLVIFRLDTDSLICSALLTALCIVPWVYFVKNRNAAHWLNLMVMQAGLISIMSLLTLATNIWLYLSTKKRTKKQK